MVAHTDDFTPYSTVTPLVTNFPTWIPELDRERIAAYQTYEEIYWGTPNAFKLQQRGDENPIYVPNARTIVDTTAHYLLKGLKVGVKDAAKHAELDKFFQDFLKREKFYSRFHVAKHSGVARGDYVLHITADAALPEGRKVSLVTVDPGRYFYVPDPDDIDKIIAVHLVDQFWDSDAQKYRIKKLTYRYKDGVNGRRVEREEGIWELDQWDNDKKAKLVRQTLRPALLPEDITTIPVYHFKNVDWQGQDYGSSELRGFERILSSINQTITDEEVALALEGLGVYATDAGRPVDDDGSEIDWEIAPARVMEIQGGTFFKRVEGIKSVTPMLEHANYLEESLMEASATFRAGRVDVQVAESGIALAIRFLPTLAKIEERDWSGVALLENLFYDLKGWFNAYESIDFEAVDIVPEIGAKLPENRTERLNELNNFLDRGVISKKYYREEAKKLGYEFPDDIEDQIREEAEEAMNLATPPELLDEEGNNVGTGNGGFGAKGGRPTGNQSNNANKTNESNGTEAK